MNARRKTSTHTQTRFRLVGFIVMVVLMAVVLGYVVRYTQDARSNVDSSDVIEVLLPDIETPSSTFNEVSVTTPAVSTTTEYVSDNKVTSVMVTLDEDGFMTLTPSSTFHGISTTFENRISWRLEDVHEKMLISGSEYVISGSEYVDNADMGQPGVFNITPSYVGSPKTATGTLMVFEASAKDGLPIHVVRVPIRF